MNFFFFYYTALEEVVLNSNRNYKIFRRICGYFMHLLDPICWKPKTLTLMFRIKLSIKISQSDISFILSILPELRAAATIMEGLLLSVGFPSLFLLKGSSEWRFLLPNHLTGGALRVSEMPILVSARKIPSPSIYVTYSLLLT